MLVEISGDGLFELFNAIESPTADLTVCQFGEEPLDHIEPGSRCGCEVKMVTRVLAQPLFHWLGFVGGVVVHDQMHIEIAGYLLIHQVEEFDELLVAMALMTLTDDIDR